MARLCVGRRRGIEAPDPRAGGVRDQQVVPAGDEHGEALLVTTGKFGHPDVAFEVPDLHGLGASGKPARLRASSLSSEEIESG